MGLCCCGFENKREVLTFGDSAMLERDAQKLHNGKDIKAICVDVYDGDTATFEIVFCGEAYHLKVRLLGIDAPELRTHFPQEKKAAQKAKEALQEKILGKVCGLRCLRNDKFHHRTVARVMIGQRNICEEMLLVPKVMPFSGKEKKVPFDLRK